MSIEDQIHELAVKHFRMSGAENSEADYLIDIIYGALSVVEDEQKEGGK